MSKRTKGLLAEKGWAAVAPWGTRPWIQSVRRTRKDVKKMLDERFGPKWSSGEPWTLIRVTIVPVPSLPPKKKPPHV